MNIINQAEYEEIKKIQNSDYSQEVFRYAEYWAELMEEKINNGEKLEDVADNTSHEADVWRIGGFQFQLAVIILCSYWQYGEQLRQWHNIKSQIKNEGEVANEEGTILNTTSMRIVV